ncbi:AI-2E family transporter [Pediococcus pentosaceus]|uniref:AI-2E family transporter n=1 Tax=Pediococcus pentosaceus TaxID=1255 RepID=UPI004035DC3E
MDNKPRNKYWRSWFNKLVLDNRPVVSLIIILLFLMILYMISKVTWIFSPLKEFFGIVGFPIILAGVLYYLINPLVDKLEQRFKLKRVLSITIIFVLITILIIAGIVSVIPVIREQSAALIKNWPDYWNSGVEKVEGFLKDPRLGDLKKQIDGIGSNTVQSWSKKATEFADNTVTSLGSVIGLITKIVIGIITMPFILFYLLKDGHRLPHFIAQFFSVKRRDGFIQILTEINTQLSQYIRGQLIVAFFVAVIFFIGYSIIGLKFALTLGVAAGFLNLIPYLGSFLAMVPSIVIGAFVSPIMLVKVLIVFVIEQTIEGRFVSPLVLGSNLDIHPVTILVVLLASGQIFGLVGVIFGIPAYAVLKVLFIHGFRAFKKNIGGYD